MTLGDPTSAVTFHVDSLYAIHTATGKSRVRKANEQLAARLRRATQALRRGRYTGPAAVRFHHVRSHRADTHMGNNIADGLAKWAVRKELRTQWDAAVSKRGGDVARGATPFS